MNLIDEKSRLNEDTNNNNNQKTKRKSKKLKNKNKLLKNLISKKKIMVIVLIIIIIFLIFIIVIILKIFVIQQNNSPKIKIFDGNIIYYKENTNDTTIKNNVYNMKKNISKNILSDSCNENSQQDFTNTINTLEDFQNACINKTKEQLAEFYFNICSEGVLLDKTQYEKSENPKLSIILPVYNRENYILRVLRSIQNQFVKEIEIIFVDDFSTDSSINIIKNYQKEDERIILIEHEKNEGTLITRNDGVYKAKGEYLMFVDTDDLLLPNVLNITYTNAKKYDYDIILFAILRRTTKGGYYRYNKYWGKKPIFQPELSSFMYYGKGYLKQIDYHLFGKLIRKEIFIKTINSIGDYYLKNHMSVNEDSLMNFMLLKKANSLKFIPFFGYIYTINPKSAIKSIYKNINKSFRDYILYLRFMIEYTDNNSHEKAMAEEQLKYVIFKFRKFLMHVTENLEFIYDSLNLYLNCSYISEDSKKNVIKMIDAIKKSKKSN